MADLKKKDGKPDDAGVHNLPESASEKATCKCQADAGKCACPDGACACPGCGKNNHISSVEHMNVHSLPAPNQDKTQCDCAAEAGRCPCPDGKCACTGCGKAKDAGNDKIAA